MKLSDLYISWEDFSMHSKLTLHKDNHIIYLGTYADMPMYFDNMEVVSYKKYNGKISVKVR